MEYHQNSTLPAPKRTPWNKGKLIGAKPPLLARHVLGRTRDLAMFNLADVAPRGYRTGDHAAEFLTAADIRSHETNVGGVPIAILTRSQQDTATR
jgi:hypothetical protein